ncbi:MAG: hypothetical protein G01um10147_688 [Microgenomates group bacterium Gr01-1014_7]|nr:MAG: hypothetical protein G01um10147_688 [Microgenomates group bacterium Gr01-1014_7]
MVAATLFTLQLIHLYWLTTHVVSFKLFGLDLFSPPPFWETIIILVDYTEIPVLITTSLVYINELRKKFEFKSVLYLIFLNSQFLHIFWITDEFVLTSFTGQGPIVNLPIWLAWIAILIDYLELPVIFETLGKAFLAVKKKLN